MDASSSKTTGLAVYPKAAKALPPMLPYSAVEFAKVVLITATDGLNVRTQPSTQGTIIKKLPYNTKAQVAIKTTVGGAYIYAGATRRDWYGIRQTNGTYHWIAAAYCKVV